MDPTPEKDTLRSRKEALRARMRSRRDELAPEERHALAAGVRERLFALPEVAAARSVLLFYSFGTEIPTAPIAEHLAAGGARLFLPYLRDGVMEAAEVPSGGALVPTDYGPKEPAEAVPVPPSEIDLVLTPGLAFDRRGGRLGYGAGHFDRYLRRLGPGALRVGIAFHVQLVREVPAGPEDEPVHVVVTDAETADARRARGDG